MTDALLVRPEHILAVLFQDAEEPIIAKVETQTISPTSLDEDLQRLEHLSLAALQDRWRTIYSQRAPRRFGAEFFRRALAYRLQETVEGGLSRQAQLRLKAWSQKSRGDDDTARPMPASIKPGTRFVREWRGETHEVIALEDEALVYRGKNYRSLTVIARQITGTHQSGPRFFGLRRQDSKAQVSEQSHG